MPTSPSNSSFSTIKALNEAAGRAGKIHQIIIMIELGEMRDGGEPQRCDIVLCKKYSTCRISK